MPNLKLRPDYQCFPLWEINDESISEDIDPNGLPISQELKRDLYAWMDKYNSTLDWEYPPDSGFKSEQEEQQFKQDGKKLQQRLQQELGAEFQISISL